MHLRSHAAPATPMTTPAIATSAATEARADGRTAHGETGSAHAACALPDDVLRQMVDPLAEFDVMAFAGVAVAWRRAADTHSAAALRAAGVPAAAVAPSAAGRRRQLGRVCVATQAYRGGPAGGTRILDDPGAGGSTRILDGPGAGGGVSAAGGVSQARVGCLRVVPATGALLVGNGRGTVRLCALPPQWGGVQQAPARELLAPGGAITSLVVADTGAWIAAGNDRGRVDLARCDGAAAAPVTYPLQGNTSAGHVTALALCDAHRYLAVAHALNQVTLYDLRHPRPQLAAVYAPPHRPRALAFAPAGPSCADETWSLLVGTDNRTLHLLERRRDRRNGIGMKAACLGLMGPRGDGTAVGAATALLARTSEMADAAGPELMASVPDAWATAIGPEALRVALSADGALIAVERLRELAVWPLDARGDDDGNSAAAGRSPTANWPVIATCLRGSRPAAFAFSPIAPHLLIGHSNGDVTLWAPREQGPGRTLARGGRGGAISAVTFAADGTAAFAADVNGEVHAWNLGRWSRTSRHPRART